MFCTQCGTKLDDDARFCTNCGVAIGGGDAVGAGNAVGASDVRDEDAYNAVASLLDSLWTDDDAPVSQTVQMPPVAFAAVPADAPTSYVAAAPSASVGRRVPSRGAVAAIVAIMCVLGIGIGVGVGVLTHGTGDGPSDVGSAAVSQGAASDSSAASSAVSSSADAGSAASSASSASSSQPAADDAAIKNMLTSYYDQLSGFDGEVRACATEFNNTYVSASMSARRASLETCKGLESRVNARLDQVKILNVPQSSAYYAKFQDICTLYDDLSHRIGVIVEAWEICVRYDDPSAHQAEITAPIARDNDGQSNIYFRDYEQRYPNARP